MNTDKKLMVRDFFAGKTVFITGGTGFLGKFIIEKLLTSCNVKKIYTLVREKKGKTVEERGKELRSDQLFRFRVPAQKLDILCPLQGDIQASGLGLSASDRQTLINEVNIVIHSAATVKFDEPLQVAMSINVLGTLSMLHLCKEIKSLQSFVYVSTAFTACYTKRLEERLYPPTADPYEVLRLMKECDTDTFNGEVFNRLKGGHPNSYTFTKSLSEWIVKDFSKLHNIPTAIAKPAIVMSPLKEPIELYVDGLTQGTPAIGASLGVALNRVIPGRKANAFPGIPVDICANEIIIAATEVATVDVSKPELNARPYGVFNTTSNTITCQTAFDAACRAALEYPTVKAVRPPSLVYFSSYELLYRIQVFIFELIFAAFFDLLLIFSGSKPKIMKILTKSHKTLKLLSFFLGQDWKVSGINCSHAFSRLSKEEQEIFYCDMSHIDWNDYFAKYWLGIRKWALREDLDNLQEAKHRLQK